MLLREMREAEERWDAKRGSIKSALKSGARVEPGIHTAKLKPYLRAGMLVPKRCIKLQVR
jgi:hypothetical protein